MSNDLNMVKFVREKLRRRIPVYIKQKPVEKSNYSLQITRNQLRLPPPPPPRLKLTPLPPNLPNLDLLILRRTPQLLLFDRYSMYLAQTRLPSLVERDKVSRLVCRMLIGPLYAAILESTPRELRLAKGSLRRCVLTPIVVEGEFRIFP